MLDNPPQDEGDAAPAQYPPVQPGAARFSSREYKNLLFLG